MKLVVFDVDGTLVDHGRLEGDFYADAFRSVFGWWEADTDWSRCRHITDGGIAREIYQRRCGRPATAGEIDRIKARFLANYQNGVHRQPGELRAMPGVREMLAQLPERDWRLAVATGAWQALAIIHVPLPEQPGLFRKIAAWLRRRGVFMGIVGRRAWTGIEDDWLGVKGGTMYWSHEGEDAYLRWLAEAGLSVEWTRFIPEGTGGHVLLLATRA
jgi:hypothetical protein